MTIFMIGEGIEKKEIQEKEMCMKETGKKEIIHKFLGLLIICLFIGTMTAYAKDYAISQKKITINVGDKYDLDIIGTEEIPKWTSWNINTVKVDGNGEVTAIRKGKTTVTARIGLRYEKCRVTVVDASVKLNKNTAVIYHGGNSGHSICLKATVKGASKEVQWQTDNPKVAIVDDNGNVTAVSSGNAKITVVANGKTAACEIMVKENKIVLDVDNIQISTKGKGKNAKITHDIVGSKKKVEWSTSNKNVAVVSNGKVTGKSQGTAIITAKANGVSASCKVQVIQNSVAIDSQKELLYIGEDKKLLTNAGKKDKVTWSSSDETIATVDEKGKITAIGAGTATITAELNDTFDTCEVSVMESTLFIEEESIFLKTKGADKTHMLNFEAVGREGVKWQTTNSKVATVDKNGKITAKKAGEATIIARANGISASVKVVVDVYAPTIKLNQSEYTLYTKKGNTYSLKATVDGPSKKVIYTSSNPEVATVNTKGKVRAVKEGQAVITATANNISAECLINVVESKVILEKDSIVLEKGEKAELPADVIGKSQSVKYVSTNKKVATVKNGVITAKRLGKADIKVTANGITAICHVLVGVCQHSYDEGVVTKEAICDELGVKTFTCISCGHTYTEDIPFTGHNFSELLSVVAPTCTEQGYSLYICHCGEIIEREFKDALDHNWGEWTVSKEPTEEEEGEEKRVCGRCETEETNILPKKEHEHSYTSVVTEPTCTEQGYTTYRCACGESYISDYVEAKDHSYIEEVTAPTCTEQGYTTHICACGESYVDTYVDANGHSMDNWRINIAPTTEAEGEKIRNCYDCDYVETEVMEKLVIEGDTIMQKMASRLNNREEKNVLEGAMPCRGDAKAIVLYLSFPDLEAHTERNTEDLEKIFFDTTDSEEWSEYERASHSVATLLKNVSYGKLNLTGDVISYTLQKESAEYGNIHEVAKEALDTFFATRELENYDANDDGYLDAVYLLFSNGNSAVASHTCCSSIEYEKDGYQSKAAVIGHNGWEIDIQTLVHESVHIMGLPDIYANVGVNISGTTADSLMDGEYSDIPAIMKFFFGWYNNFIEVGETEEVTLKSYSAEPEFMVIYPNGNVESEFIFLVEYVTQEKNNWTLDYLGEKGGLRIWRVLLNVDENYGISGNDLIYAMGNSPYRYLEAVHPWEEINYILKEGQEWTPYTNPSSFYGTKVSGGLNSYLTDKLYSGISIKELSIKEGEACFMVNIDPVETQREPQFDYILKANSISSKRSDNTWEMFRVSAETEVVDNSSNSPSYLVADGVSYEMSGVSTMEGNYISFVISDEIHEKLITKESVKIVLGKDSVKTYYGVGNELQEFETKLIHMKTLEKEGEAVYFSNAYGSFYSEHAQAVKISDDEVVAVVYNTVDYKNLKSNIYRMIKYTMSSNEVVEVELKNSFNQVITQADGSTEFKLWLEEDSDFNILTEYGNEYYCDKYSKDGEWISSEMISSDRYYSYDSSVYQEEDKVQKFEFLEKDIIMKEYDANENLLREVTLVKDVPIDPNFKYKPKVQKLGGEYSLSFKGVPENAAISYGHSYLYTIDSKGMVKHFYHYEECSTVNTAAFIRMTENKYIMIERDYFQCLEAS